MWQRYSTVPGSAPYGARPSVIPKQSRLHETMSSWQDEHCNSMVCALCNGTAPPITDEDEDVCQPSSNELLLQRSGRLTERADQQHEQ